MNRPPTFAAALAAAVIFAGTARAALPPEVAAKIAEGLPAAVSPMPAAGGAKIFPATSEKRLSPDRRYAVTIGDAPYSLTAVAEDGKAVEMSVPSGLHSTEFTNRWFKAEDVFGKVKWAIEDYEAPCQNLTYFPGGKHAPELAGVVQKGDRCVSLGTVAAGKAKYRLLQVAGGCEASGGHASWKIVLAKESPPIKTQAEYNARAAEMLAEYSYRQGREWGKDKHALLTDEGWFECAAMVSDFAKYMFGESARGGEQFAEPDDIRSGDIIDTGSHWFAVVHRKGGQLHTIEGNMNERVNQSKTFYSIKDGRLHCGGKPTTFASGKHFWPPAGAAK